MKRDLAVSADRQDLPIIQKVYDLVLWYIPHVNRWPKDHRFLLGDRLGAGLYDLLDGLVGCRYLKDKERRLTALNGLLDRLRYQTRLAHDFKLFDARRYEFASKALNEIGNELGGWIKQQAKKGEAVGGRP
jgi:hypothetical protein